MRFEPAYFPYFLEKAVAKECTQYTYIATASVHSHIVCIHVNAIGICIHYQKGY